MGRPQATEARAHVDALVRAALAAADPSEAVRRALRREGGRLWVGERRYDLSQFERVLLVGGGKAALGMAQAAVEALGERLDAGRVMVPAGQETASIPGTTLYPAAHPLPDARNLAGARAIAQLAQEAGPKDLLICLISGGGSAHLMLPAGDLSLDDLRAVTDALLRAGADIYDLNAVRKHCERLKGGGLARLAAPAKLAALILSDVVGDRLDVIASGPAAPDPTTYADALDVLARHGTREASPAVTAHLEAGARGEHAETAKPGNPIFVEVKHQFVGSNRMAVGAAAVEAERLGFTARVHGEPIQGEAREVGASLAEAARAMHHADRPGPECVVYGGETTVTVRGRGRGGRNQELALAAAVEIDGLEGVVVATLATDGVDGPTDAAGAIATGETLKRARALGLDARSALDDNDSYTFFEALGDLIQTGPTGTNVNDLALVLVY